METLKSVEIKISSKIENKKVVFKISDNGPGISQNSELILENGIGLSNTVERLEKLYGSEQSFQFQNKSVGGLEVKLEIPFQNPLDENNK